jgi:hypothetical protein
MRERAFAQIRVAVAENGVRNSPKASVTPRTYLAGHGA